MTVLFTGTKDTNGETRTDLPLLKQGQGNQCQTLEVIFERNGKKWEETRRNRKKHVKTGRNGKKQKETGRNGKYPKSI